ncbi:glycosyltransferase [Sphaerotilaceae bacterium SBD11-9]
MHHGGIGTTSQAMLAGVPQLIRPMVAEQFDNASHAVRSGVARQLLPRRYRPQAAARLLDELAADTALRAQCDRVAHRLSGEPSGISATCDALLSLPLHR